jgi:hemin uptake protein HemP
MRTIRITIEIMTSPIAPRPPKIAPQHAPPGAPQMETSKAKATPPALNSAELFAAGDTVIIVHNDEHYCLRRTRQNRLILTK